LYIVTLVDEYYFPTAGCNAAELVLVKNEKYNIDISKIPAGKYLVTVVNGKTYTTPQKLVVVR